MACDTFNIPCQVTEAIDSLFDKLAHTLGDFGYEVLKSSFSNSGGTISNSQWSVAAGMTSRWGLVLLVVVVGLTLVQMGQALLQGRTQQAASAFIVGVCTWPVTIFSVWITVKLTDATDRLAVGILNAGNDSGKDVISTLMDLTPPATDTPEVSLKGAVVLIMGGGALVGALLLSFMLAFRNFALLVLIGFAPVAFMCLPMGVARAVVTRWASLVVALIIAKPLAAGILVMANELLVAGDKGFWAWIVALVAMAMAAFAPIITMRLFSFIGGDRAAAMGSHGASVAQNTAGGAAKAGKAVGGMVA